MTDPQTILLLILSLTGVVGGCRRARVDADVDSLNRLQKQVDSTIISGDTERYLTFLADDAVLMPPNAPAVSGNQAIRLWHQAISRQFRIQKYAATDDEVIVSGNWALRRASMDWTLMPAAGGKPIRDLGKFIILYRREPDGSWKVARDIWNSSSPAP